MDPPDSSSVDSSTSKTKSDAESHVCQDVADSKPPCIVKSPSIPMLMHEGKYSKVLVIYTGGTIGMIRTENGGLYFLSNSAFGLCT